MTKNCTPPRRIWVERRLRDTGTSGQLNLGHVRAVLTTLTFGMLVVARTQSVVAAVALTICGVAAATNLASRAAIAVLGILILLGVPWIASPLVAGVVWFILAHRREMWSQIRSITSHVWKVGGLVAAGAGLLAGAIASPFAQAQASITPIVFNIVQPPTVLVISALIIFALANAVGEELLWRGALVQETHKLSTTMQYIVQFLSFGLAHWHGLPGGATGCLLTGTGSLLFFWIHRHWGLGASIRAHLVADITILIAILPLILSTGWAAA